MHRTHTRPEWSGPRKPIRVVCGLTRTLSTGAVCTPIKGIKESRAESQIPCGIMKKSRIIMWNQESHRNRIDSRIIAVN